MRIEVTGADGELSYRQLGPDDASAIWRCCGQRSPRPSLNACQDILSDQLEADAGAEYLERPDSEAVRRLFLVFDGEPVVLLTARVPSAARGTPTLEADPAGEDLGGNAAWDGVAWLSAVGYQSADVTIYWPGGIEQFTVDPLPGSWLEGRVLTFEDSQ